MLLLLLGLLTGIPIPITGSGSGNHVSSTAFSAPRKRSPSPFLLPVATWTPMIHSTGSASGTHATRGMSTGIMGRIGTHRTTPGVDDDAGTVWRASRSVVPVVPVGWCTRSSCRQSSKTNGDGGGDGTDTTTTTTTGSTQSTQTPPVTIPIPQQQRSSMYKVLSNGRNEAYQYDDYRYDTGNSNKGGTENWVKPSRSRNSNETCSDDDDDDETDEIDLVMSDFTITDSDTEPSVLTSNDNPQSDETTTTTTGSSIYYYDVGLSAVARHDDLLETGPLSLKIYSALSESKFMTRKTETDTFSPPTTEAPTEATTRMLLYQMTLEFTALQVLQVLLQQSGLELYAGESTGTYPIDDTSDKRYDSTSNLDQPPRAFSWNNTLESMRFWLPINNTTADTGNPVDHDIEANNDRILVRSLDEAIQQGWAPGETFGFVVRNVPVTRQSVALPELLASLDPDGTLRQQAIDAGIILPQSKDDIQASSDDWSNDSFDSLNDLRELTSLSHMAAFNRYRTEVTPRTVASSQNVYTGDNSAGYRVVSANRLLSPSCSATNNELFFDETTVRHVMNAFVSHGCLLVDVTNGGQDFDDARRLHDMWQATERLFNYVDEAETFHLPGYSVADQASRYARLGFVTQENGNLQCYETRLCRSSGELRPIETQSVLGVETCHAWTAAYGRIAHLCRHVIQLVVAASLEEATDIDVSPAQAHAYAARLVDEVVDYGRDPMNETNSDKHSVMSDMSVKGSALSMSPHRFCRYRCDIADEEEKDAERDYALFGTNNGGGGGGSSGSEVFGAHTDSTFLTAIPVADVAGLEVFDEAANCWYRPELAARRHYEQQCKENSDNQNDIPWHCRYVILMPGELLQLVSRHEVLATVHRVIVLGQQTQQGKRGVKRDIETEPSSRLSAPILLRGRAGVPLDCERYLGGVGASPMLHACDGQSMECIDADLMYQSR